MTPMKPTQAILLCSLVTLGASDPPAAGAPQSPMWTICTDELELIESAIDQMNQNEIILIDKFGVRRSISTADIFFVHPTSREDSQLSSQSLDQPIENSPRSDAQQTRFISLTDGQIIQGIINDSDNPDVISYTLFADATPRGHAQIDLEHILTIGKSSPFLTPVASEPLQSDTITTTAGDRIMGFIESIGTTTNIDTDDGMVQIPLQRIDTIALANIKEPTPGFFLTTDSGSRFRSDDFSIDFAHSASINGQSESIGLKAEAQTNWLLKPNDIAAADVLHSSKRIESLASIAPGTIEPTGDRSWTPTPTLIQSPANPIHATIDLRAPVRVLYPLPNGSSRFACTLVAQIGTWTDCNASIIAHTRTKNSTVLFTAPMNADQPTHKINIILPPNTTGLEIRIDPGNFGPIQDRVLIKDPRLLIES